MDADETKNSRSEPVDHSMLDETDAPAVEDFRRDFRAYLTTTPVGQAMLYEATGKSRTEMFAPSETAFDKLKWIVDRFSSILLMVFPIGPLILLIACLIKATSRGSAFVSSTRVGMSGRLFHLYKFRVKYQRGEQEGPVITDTDDGELTKLGRFLRLMKLEWLPEIWNICVGDMSWIGPRPHSPFFLTHFSEQERDIILSVRPGLVGPTQLRFRFQRYVLRRKSDKIGYYVDVLLPIKRRMEVDYVIRRSFRRDIGILFAAIYLGRRLFSRGRRRFLGSSFPVASDAEQTLANPSPRTEDVQWAYRQRETCDLLQDVLASGGKGMTGSRI